MNRVFADLWTVLTQFEFFAPRLATHGVIILTALFADQKHGFSLLFTFFSGHDSSSERCLVDKRRAIIVDSNRVFGRGAPTRSDVAAISAPFPALCVFLFGRYNPL